MKDFWTAVAAQQVPSNETHGAEVFTLHLCTVLVRLEFLGGSLSDRVWNQQRPRSSVDVGLLFQVRPEWLWVVSCEFRFRFYVELRLHRAPRVWRLIGYNVKVRLWRKTGIIARLDVWLGLSVAWFCISVQLLAILWSRSCIWFWVCLIFKTWLGIPCDISFSAEPHLSFSQWFLLSQIFKFSLRWRLCIWVRIWWCIGVYLGVWISLRNNCFFWDWSGIRVRVQIQIRVTLCYIFRVSGRRRGCLAGADSPSAVKLSGGGAGGRLITVLPLCMWWSCEWAGGPRGLRASSYPLCLQHIGEERRIEENRSGHVCFYHIWFYIFAELTIILTACWLESLVTSKMYYIN